MGSELSYGDVEATLAGLNRISDSNRVAFRARLKHFQRMGFPPGINTGTGRRAVYDFRRVMMLAFATELSQAGMAPKRVVKILTANWPEVEWSLLVALTPESFFDRWEPSVDANKLIWMLSPEALRDLSVEGEGEYDYYESIRIARIDDLPRILTNDDEGSPVVGEHYRRLIIHLRPFLMVILWHLTRVRPDLEPDTLWRDLEAHLVERGRRMTEAMKAIDLVMAKPAEADNGDDQEA